MLNSPIEFNAIPPFFPQLTTTQFTSYIPIVLMDEELDVRSGISIGRSINFEAVATEEEALELARACCLSMNGAIGYAARGVHYE